MPRNIPLAVILSWPTPNYVNPETHGPGKTILTVFLWTVVTAILCLRLYTRRFISFGFGWDDILITLAYVPATAFSIVGIVAEYVYGWNLHTWDVPTDKISIGLQLGLASFTLFDFATSLTKLSMLALLYRMAADSIRLRYTVWGLVVVITGTFIAFLVVLFIQCRPISDYWTIRLSPTNTCIDESKHLLIAGIINTFFDFVIVLLPMGVVWRLQRKAALPRRQMIAVVMLFGAGLGASLAGVVRTYLTWVMTTSDDFDLTWHAWVTYLASSIELYVGIICVSIPATKPFFGRYLPRVLFSALSRGHFSDVESSGAKELTFQDRSPPNSSSLCYAYATKHQPSPSSSSVVQVTEKSRPPPIQVERTVHIHRQHHPQPSFTSPSPWPNYANQAHHHHPHHPHHSRNLSSQSAVTLVGTRVYSPNSPGEGYYHHHQPYQHYGHQRRHSTSSFTTASVMSPSSLVPGVGIKSPIGNQFSSGMGTGASSRSPDLNKPLPPLIIGVRGGRRE